MSLYVRGVIVRMRVYKCVQIHRTVLQQVILVCSIIIVDMH